MTENSRGASPRLDVELAGVKLRSPLALAPVGGGSHLGRRDADAEREVDISRRFLLDHVAAGSSLVYLNISYLTEASLLKLLDGAAPPGRRERLWTERFLRAGTPVRPYGVEGLYSAVTPGPGIPDLEMEKRLVQTQRKLVGALRSELPEGVRLVGGVVGCGGLPDAYVDGARMCEELGFDLIELNFHCPLQAGMRGGVDNTLERVFPPFSQGGLMGEHPDLVERIAEAVVKAVGRTPVGAKFSAEAGFPRIVDLARRAKDAGVRYVAVGGAGVGIAPPDIYKQGRPSWPFADGNPFCLASGSWMRRICHRDVAAVARFVPGLDIVASGGLVTPEHCVEAMMLGATVTEVCTGVIEQGRGLLRRSNAFLRTFLAQQGYAGVRDVIGLSLPYIKHPEDLDLMPGRVVSRLDEERCTRCGHCLDNLCVAITSDHGRPVIDEDRCLGCGGCLIACQADAFSLYERS